MPVLSASARVLPQTAPVRALLTTLRNDQTPSDQFRPAAHALARILAAAALEEERTETIWANTPLTAFPGHFLVSGGAALVPILRAGMALEEAFCDLLPNPHVWYVGIGRNHETLQPSEYLCTIPTRVPDEVETCYVLDPMLATGGSADFAIRRLKERGAQRIVFVGIVGAPEGVNFLRERHPDVPVHLAVLDSHLNEKGYIVPGLGDFGDRYCNSL